MKNWLPVVLIGFAVAVATSSGCSTDIDLNAPFVETPVMIGLLDLSEDTHFVRINRAFLEEGQNALVLARDPAQIYYGPGLSVRLEELDNGNITASFPLVLVNGDSLGRPKASGTFAEVPNLLYRHVGALRADRRYRVVAEDPSLDLFFRAETGILPDFTVVRPSPNPSPGSSLSFAGNADFQVRWNHSLGAKIYEMNLRYYIREVSSADLNVVLRDTVLVWPVFDDETVFNPDVATTLDFNIPRDGFYTFLTQNFSPNSGVIRFVDSLDFEFLAGDEELFNYILVGSAQLGITADQIGANYTNVEGGLGLLASRFRKATIKYPLNNQTQDRIGCGSITGGLNFAASGDSPFYPFCP
jgi:hypothetical protein